eukprot:tig00021608_g22842.t1
MHLGVNAPASGGGVSHALSSAAETSPWDEWDEDRRARGREAAKRSRLRKKEQFIGMWRELESLRKENALLRRRENIANVTFNVSSEAEFLRQVKGVGEARSKTNDSISHILGELSAVLPPVAIFEIRLWVSLTWLKLRRAGGAPPEPLLQALYESDEGVVSDEEREAMLAHVEAHVARLTELGNDMRRIRRHVEELQKIRARLEGENAWFKEWSARASELYRPEQLAHFFSWNERHLAGLQERVIGYTFPVPRHRNPDSPSGAEAEAAGHSPLQSSAAASPDPACSQWPASSASPAPRPAAGPSATSPTAARRPAPGAAPIATSSAFVPPTGAFYFAGGRGPAPAPAHHFHQPFFSAIGVPPVHMHVPGAHFQPPRYHNIPAFGAPVAAAGPRSSSPPGKAPSPPERKRSAGEELAGARPAPGPPGMGQGFDPGLLRSIIRSTVEREVSTLFPHPHPPPPPPHPQPLPGPAAEHPQRGLLSLQLDAGMPPSLPQTPDESSSPCSSSSGHPHEQTFLPHPHPPLPCGLAAASVAGWPVPALGGAGFDVGPGPGHLAAFALWSAGDLERAALDLQLGLGLQELKREPRR